MNNHGIRVCDSCGLPPRDNKKLRSCSRCKSTWYHDLECQKRHYPTHKKTCRSPVLVSKPKEPKPQSSKFVTENRTGRGNCLVASSLIEKGERIHVNTRSNESWEPLVLPVLRSDNRRTRCAYCFKSLDNSNFFRYDQVQPRQQYFLLFCSSHCRNAGRDKFLLQEEERAIGRLYNNAQHGGPPKILPTAVLVYRLIVATQFHRSKRKLIESEIDKLQHEFADTTIDTKLTNSDHHTQAVITTVVAMIQESSSNDDYNLALPAIEEMKRMVNRIKLNGFSICDGESVAMGIGLFGTPSFMNHSCKPNAVQTFVYGRQGEPPSLLVTAFENITNGEEICISYIDNLAPKQIRRHRLKQNYFFDCCCIACEDQLYNTGIIGLKCGNCDATSPKMIMETSQAPGQQILKCQECDDKDPHDGFPILETMELVSTIDNMMKFYNKLKQSYSSESWYVQNCGDQLVQMLLDLLGSQADDDQQQRSTTSRVLKLLNELNTSHEPKAAHIVWSGSFRHFIRQYKAAKLGLFLHSDPREAISELQRVRKSLSPYFTEDHELIQGIDDCMRSGIG